MRISNTWWGLRGIPPISTLSIVASAIKSLKQWHSPFCSNPFTIIGVQYWCARIQPLIKIQDYQIFGIFAKGSVLSLAAQLSPSLFAILRKDEL